MSWKFVLYSNHKYFGHIDIFFKDVVVPSGYEFFTWNGVVYMVLKDQKYYQRTNLTIEDLF